MPTVRYQIRNEYGLADPELYQAADKDDPEAILEGVAMAGLVGVLRQLGDLAEFAAQVFHDLHEEVTTTAARGHGLLLRVQQLEAEFPSIEKAFLVQTSHSHFAYNDGIDWSTNLRMDQNLVTQGDMPRFILDSYEECRGPPRLFMLDKFDVAGAGACSKRYSDPSFFKVKFASSGMMEEEVRWEKKARKTRKKASRWRNGETIESFLLPLINSDLKPENSVQVSARVPARRVKLKSRNLLDSDITNRKSYMEHLLEVHSPEQKVWSENPITHSPVIIKSIDYSGLTPEVHETVIDAIADSTIIRETYPTQSHSRKYVSYIPKNELENHKVKSVEILEPAPKKEMTVPEIKTKVSFDHFISDKAEKRNPPLLEVDQMKPIADGEFSTEGGFDGDKSDRYRSNEAEKSPAQPEVDPKKSLAYAEFSPEDEYDEYKSDDISSDVENYMDALNTMESGVETNSERRDKLDRGISSMEAHRIDSGICEEQKELQAQLSEPDSVGKSTPRGWNNVLKHPPHNTVIFCDLADTQKPLDHVSGFCVPPNQDNFLKESPDETLDELQGNDKVTACASSVHLLPNGTFNVKESDVTSINSELGEASSGSCVMDLMSGDIHTCPQESDETQSVTSHPDDANGCLEGTRVVSQLLHCKGEELPDSANNPNDNSGESIPLSEMGDLSFERKDVHEGTQPAEFLEEQTSELIAGKIDMPDHLPETKHESSIEEIPAQHTGESTLNLSANSGKQEESIKEEEACSDGSVSPNIPESSPEISSNDVKSSKEVARDLDGTLPRTDDTEFTEPIINLRISSDDLLPLSDIPVIINSTEDIEPVISEDMKDIQGKTIPEEVCFGHVEDSPVSTVQLKASQDPIEQDNRTSSHENMFPPDAALSLENNQFIMQPDVPHMGVRNVVAGVEDTSAEVMGERKTPSPKIVPLELEYFSDVEEPHESHEVNSADLSADCSTLSFGKETSHDGMQLQLNSSAEDGGKSNIIMPNIKPLEFGHFSDVEEPQEIHDADSGEHLSLESANAVLSADLQLQKEEPGFMVNFDSEEPKESHHAAPMEHLPLDSANEIFINEMQLLNKECGLVVRSDADDPKESSTADSAEHVSLDFASEVFRDNMQLQNEEIGCMLIDGAGAEAVAGNLGLPSGSEASNFHKESLKLEKHTESDDSLGEYIIVEANDSNHDTSSVYAMKASGLDVQLQENYLPKDAVLDWHDVEADSSDLKNLTLLSQTESQPILSTEVWSSKLPVLHSSDPSDLDGGCCTLPSQPTIDTENLVYSSENRDSGSNEGTCPSSHFLVEPEIPPGDDSEPNVGSTHQEDEHLEASDTQLQRTCTDDNNLPQRISRDIADQPSKPEPSGICSNGENNEFDTSLTNLGVHEEVEDEASVASRFSPEISVASSVSSHPAAGLPPIESSTTISETSLQEAAIANSSQAISETSLQEAAIASSSQDSSETNLPEGTVASSTEAISETSLQEATIASSSQAISETCLKETSEPWPGEPAAIFQSQDVIETPPLPPLPPMQWRLGKVRLGSLTSSGDTIQPPIMTNPFTELTTGEEKHTQGPMTNAAEMVRPENSFAFLPVVEKERYQHRSLISEEEIVHPSRLSELPPIAGEERQQRSLILEREMTNPSNPLAVSDTEDGKFSSGLSAPVPAPEDLAAQHPQLSQEERHHGQHRRPQLGHLLPSLELERSQHEVLSVARATIPPVNPFFVRPSTEEWRDQYGYGVYGGKNVQHLNLSVPLAARGANMPPYGFFYSMGENPSNTYDFMTPTVEGEKPNWRYRSIRDRPRDPLIEAVAAHDRNKLRKVSELDRPSDRPKADERDSLLEQIRNKSFNLKPANAAKPNIKGVPPTNLKVAAILEKANAIRQACAGSDEDDDDGDNWSDS